MQFEEIYELYFKDVYRFLLSLTNDEPLAEELSQETFFKALKAIDRFDSSSDIRAWLFTIARNSYYSYYKFRKNTISMQEVENDIPTGVDFTEESENEQHTFQIHQILHNMKEPYKEVFSLRVFGELPFEKIARLFGKSAAWARVTFYRAKTMIIEHMEEMNHERN